MTLHFFIHTHAPKYIYSLHTIFSHTYLYWLNYCFFHKLNAKLYQKGFFNKKTQKLNINKNPSMNIKTN